MDNPITSVDKLEFLKRVAADDRLNATDLRCCIYIADYFNAKKGRAWPSYGRLCKDTNTSRASVARSVRKLDKFGIISRDSGHKGRSNSYFPAFAAVWQSDSAAQTSALLGDGTNGAVTSSHDRDESSLNGETTSGSAMRPNTVTTPRSNQRRGCSNNPSGLAASADAAAAAGGAPGQKIASEDRRLAKEEDASPVGPKGFDAFWNAYPKKEGRARATRAYKTALATGVTAEVLSEKATQYGAAKAQVRDPLYVKMAANWLAEQCWLEDPQPPRPKPPKPGFSDGGDAQRGRGKKRSKRAQREKAIREATRVELLAEQKEKSERRLAKVAADRKATMERRLATRLVKQEQYRAASAARKAAARDGRRLTANALQTGAAVKVSAPVPPPPATPAAALDDLDVYRRALGMLV